MSSKPRAPSDSAPDRAATGVRNAALRLAFGVTGCFAIVEALDWDATFLAPLLAANMLVKTPRPPSLAQGLVVVILFASSTAAVLVLSMFVISNPQVLIMALIQLFFLSFYAHRLGAPDLATLPSPDLGRVASDRRRPLAGRCGRIREDVGGGRLRCAAHCLGGTRGIPGTCGRGGRGDARRRHLIG